MLIVNHFIRILIGVFFVLSGITKLYPIEPFEIIFVDLGISNFFIAPFIARFIIVFEIFLGLCIVFDCWFKDIIYKLVWASLVVFTIYLVYLLITEGNAVDCGCFGSFLTLNPIQSIIKNLGLLIVLLFVKRRYHQEGVFLYTPLLFLSIAIATTFSLNPIGLHNLQGIEVNQKIDYSNLPKTYIGNKKENFSEGKKIVAFFSSTCSHCLNASRIFTSVGKNKEINNLYYVIGAKTEKSLNSFLEQSNSNYPIIWINDDTFFKYSGGRLPAIVYLDNGVIKKKWFGDLFDVEEVKQYLN
ncbi:MAG: DoxX family protein [Vicingaceae bacterium]